MDINYELNRLVHFGLQQGLIQPEDTDYTVNQLLNTLKVADFQPLFLEECLTSAEPILKNILEWALCHKRLLEDTIDGRDLFDTQLMAHMMPRPSEVNAKFQSDYKISPKTATDHYYHLSKASNYIRQERVAKDKRWKVATDYGQLDITINLSKPEKDPKTIARALSLPQSNYPSCLLCKENVGFSGHLSHPARGNHRIIPMTLKDEQWYFQYSPYVYYNEHCIVLKGSHDPMKISRDTFERLLDFVEILPHYFVGSNADLPIVGGSILTHDHFQGGSYTFAMENANSLLQFERGNIRLSFLKWPLSVLRLNGSHKGEVLDLAEKILQQWQGYSDESLGIKAFTGDTPHHTITPIARFKDGVYELDLVLRDNQTSGEHPDGIYHPHQHLHHLKKENIGLIEVMGLAVLPGRLLQELEAVKVALANRNPQLLIEKGLEKHLPWLHELLSSYATTEDADSIIEQEIGKKFVEVLECAGVYKQNAAGIEGIKRFLSSI
ncbi:MAG: UDP-glucose--hexose-1-phosphate uridylyltransferase [Turicibacter sp.]|nr:UDP-glucose--hexose-1-phosphate uridylyltransferase [Turicibacter sp.]